MPWCEDCSKYWNPSSMREDGSCPTCGRVLARGERVAPVSEPQSEPTPYDASTIDVKALAGKEGKAPWHFKLLVLALVLYLGWRLVDMVRWIIG
jgi:hypothetical protein